METGITLIKNFSQSLDNNPSYSWDGIQMPTNKWERKSHRESQEFCASILIQPHIFEADNSK